MENENFLLNSSTSLPPLNMEVQGMEMNYLPSCLFDLNWDNSIDQRVQFKSELSSIVSSPNSSNAAAPSDCNLARESIVKSHNICSLNEISPQSQILDSPHGISPPPIFRNSATRTHGSLSPGSADPGAIEVSSRKRKAAPRGKSNAKVPKAEEGDSIAKKCRSVEATETGNSVEKPNQKQNKDSVKPAEPPKQDYIHVRARRGQATDSHSLAERVRREKISERMKLLQDLVPGCNKVTGKAPMLDEIINYVQSLQCQVEFLSMKLASVNPRLDFNMETLLSKNIPQSPGSFPHMMNPLDSSAPPTFSYGYQPQHGPLQSVVCNGSKVPYTVNPLETIDGYGGSAFPIGNLLEYELQSMVHQIGFEQNCETALPLQMFRGPFPKDHMKIEL